MYNRNQSLHFIGIGGVGMAGIAEVLLDLGYTISGSDISEGKLIKRLRLLGATIGIGHRVENIPEVTSCVVYSSAVTAENPEMVEARRRGIPIIPRAEMLAELMRMKYGIAVGGSHGKTTTTSLIAHVLTDAGIDPTVIVGGRLLNQQSGASVGQGEYLVAESDESDGSFNLLRPAIAVVTNIDREHMSHYGSFGDLEQAFFDFMSSVPFYGLVVGCADDPVVAKLLDRLERRVVRYGFSPGVDIRATNICTGPNGTQFSLECFGEHIESALVTLPGAHMVGNALATIAVCLELGVYLEEAVASLATFPGVARRAELIGAAGGVSVYDDYGHHPTEIRATLKAIKESKVALDSGGRLLVVFQPHRYSRTKELFSDFLTCFVDADTLVITDIYAASEEPIAGVSAELLAGALEHPDARHVGDMDEIVSVLSKMAKPGDVVLTLGAGSVTTLAPRIVQVLEELYGDESQRVNQSR